MSYLQRKKEKKMANSLFNLLGNNSMSGPFSNMQDLLQRLSQFRQSFQGDPKQQVQQLLNSGRMSQNQYNQLSQMATQIQNMLTKN